MKQISDECPIGESQLLIEIVSKCWFVSNVKRLAEFNSLKEHLLVAIYRFSPSFLQRRPEDIPYRFCLGVEKIGFLCVVQSACLGGVLDHV